MYRADFEVSRTDVRRLSYALNTPTRAQKIVKYEREKLQQLTQSLREQRAESSPYA